MCIMYWTVSQYIMKNKCSQRSKKQNLGFAIQGWQERKGLESYTKEVGIFLAKLKI